MLKKIQEDLSEAVKHLQIADHMAYVTFPIINEKRLLIKIFEETYKAVMRSINAALNQEYQEKKIKIYDDASKNLDTFFVECAKDYGLTVDQLQRIKEIINIQKKHIESSMEFVRKEHLVILSDNLQTQTLNIILVKTYLLAAKELFVKINNSLKGS